MAQNLRELPPSKRFKILNSEQISRPLNTIQEDDQMSLPAKKRDEILGSSSTSACLPAKKRVEILNNSSIACLPAKKRVWEPHPLSPAKSETQAQDGGSLIEDKGRIKDGAASNGVPVKKRLWAPCLLSPTKTETQAPHTDTKHADVEGQYKGGEETNRLPAKKRVWIDHPSTPALVEAREEVPNLKPVQEKDQIDHAKEMKEIYVFPAKKRVFAPNLLSAIQDVTTSKRVLMELPLTLALLEGGEEIMNLKSVQLKDHTKVKEVKETHGVPAKKRVLAPNPSPAIREVTTKKQVLMENPITPSLLEFQEEATTPEPVQEDQIQAKKVKESQGVPTKKRVPAPNPSSTSLEVAAKKRAWMEHPFTPGVCGFSPKKQVWAPKNRVCAVHPLSPITEEKEHTEYQTKRAKEISPVLAKRWIWAPEPLAPTKIQIKQHTDPKPDKQRAENEFKFKDGNEICGVPLKQVCAMHPSSPAITETQIEEKGPESIEEEIDDGVLCAVCQSTDGDPSDPIVFCDGCDLMVHASCYGNPLIKSIPEGDWFCSACSSKTPQKENKCCLCPVRGGALKPTVDEKWAHVMCALLVPEVFFQDPEGREGIDCSRVPRKRWQKDCFICGRNYGCALDCAENKCKLGFHVSCGLEEGLCIEYREAKGGDIVAGFCSEHTKLWKKQQLTGKFKIVSTD